MLYVSLYLFTPKIDKSSEILLSKMPTLYILAMIPILASFLLLSSCSASDVVYENVCHCPGGSPGVWDQHLQDKLMELRQDLQCDVLREFSKFTAFFHIFYWELTIFYVGPPRTDLPSTEALSVLFPELKTVAELEEVTVAQYDQRVQEFQAAAAAEATAKQAAADLRAEQQAVIDEVQYISRFYWNCCFS